MATSYAASEEDQMERQIQQQRYVIDSRNNNTNPVDAANTISKRIDETRRSISSLKREVQRRVLQWSTVDSDQNGGGDDGIIPWTTSLTAFDGESNYQNAVIDSTTLLELSEILFSRTSPMERLEYITTKAVHITAEIDKLRAEMEQAELSTISVDEADDATTGAATTTTTNYQKCLEELKDQCLFLRQCQEVTTILDSYQSMSSLVMQAQDLQKAKSILELHLGNRQSSSIVSQLQIRVSKTTFSLKQAAMKIIQQNIIITKASIQVITQKSPQGEIDNSKNYGLKDAWECLLTLSSSSFGCAYNDNQNKTAHTPLDSLLWELTLTLQSQVIQPLLEEFQSRLDNHSINGHLSRLEPILVTVHQGTETYGRVIYCRWNIDTVATTSSSSSSSKTYDNKKIHQVETIFNIQQHQEQWEALTNALQSIFTFFFNHALEENAVLASHVGKLILFHPLSTTSTTKGTNSMALKIISTARQRHHQKVKSVVDSLRQVFWEHCFPNTMDYRPILHLLQTSTYDTFIKATSRLEEALKKSHYIPQEDDWFLTTFVKDFPTKYCEKKRVQVLMHARNIIMQSDYNTVVPVGVEETLEEEDSSQNVTEEEKTMKSFMSIFYLPKCSISVVAQNILDLVRKTMMEAAEVSCIAASQKSNPTHVDGNDTSSITSDSNIASCCSQQLFLAARECFDIFRAVIPSLYRKDLYTFPRSAAIFHNDCTYFVHACTTLGLEFADQMTATTPICTFVDMVPVFRELGNNIMMEMIKRQRHETLEILASHQITNGLLEKSLRMNEAGLAWSEAETAVRAVQLHFNLISRAWKDILSRDVFFRGLGAVVDVFLSTFLDPVLKADEISESASQFVGSLYRSIQLQFGDLFSSGTYKQSFLKSKSVSSTSIARSYCTVWDRFVTVGEILQMSLSDIQEGLPFGKFVTITGAELSHLIMATFDDSEKRRVLLQALSDEED